MSALGVQGVEPSVGFDIEVKMATPPDVPVTPAHEVDRMVIAILDQVQAVATHSSRPIVFSSFDPEICRQVALPWLPLSEQPSCALPIRNKTVHHLHTSVSGAVFMNGPWAGAQTGCLCGWPCFFLLVDLQLHARRRACYISCMQRR